MEDYPQRVKLDGGLWDFSSCRGKQSVTIAVSHPNDVFEFRRWENTSPKRKRDEDNQETCSEQSVCKTRKMIVTDNIYEFSIDSELQQLIVENTRNSAKLSNFTFDTFYKLTYDDISLEDEDYMLYRKRVGQYSRSLCTLFLQRINKRFTEGYLRKFQTPELRYLVLETWNFEGICHLPEILTNIKSIEENRLDAFMFAIHFDENQKFGKLSEPINIADTLLKIAKQWEENPNDCEPEHPPMPVVDECYLDVLTK